MPRDQTQPGSFSREREEPGNEVVKAAAETFGVVCAAHKCMTVFKHIWIHVPEVTCWKSAPRSFF